MTDIQIYGAAWCQPCTKAKKFLDSKGIDYTYHDVENEPGAMDTLKSLGFSGVPVIVRDGEAELGFKQGRFADLI